MTPKTQPIWYSITLTVKPKAAEAMEFALNSLSALGTEIDSLRKTSSDDLRVTGYFDALPGDDTVQAEIDYALKAYGLTDDAVISYETEKVEQRDWLAEWKKHWNAEIVGNFVVAPAWQEVDAEGKHLIRIDPSMAFGTGTHETTKLCLEAIDEFYSPEMSLLDVGTGTGILTIAAAKIVKVTGSKPETMTAFDNDADSVKIAKENVEMNGVGDLIDIFAGTLDDVSESYQMVCANLTLDVILPILTKLVERAEKILVLSGILAEQQKEIENALSEFENISYRVTQKGEWISVIIKTDAA